MKSFPVTIYKCQYLGAYAGRADCSLCQTRDNKFGCVWCLNQCLYNDQCTDLPIINTCPPPRIDYVNICTKKKINPADFLLNFFF